MSSVLSEVPSGRTETSGSTPLERCPLPVPFGWFFVSYSEDLKAAEVRNIQYFGQEWVMFRGETGEAGVVDPYCPHLGAHLGHGGKVEGDSLRCPFHHWAYNPTGWCTKIPYAKIMPPITKRQAILRALPVCGEERHRVGVVSPPGCCATVGSPAGSRASGRAITSRPPAVSGP